MRRFIRLLRRLLTGLGVFVLLLAAVVTGVLWFTLPPRSQQARIPGLNGPIDIGFDSDGIPRIRATSSTDAAAALGFVHARDRLFEMELMRRAASGRLSEIAGPSTLGLDRMMRTLGLRRRAVEDYAALPPGTRAMLQAYASGVNAWIETRGRFSSPEFLILGTPEPWEPVDCLLWAKTMGLWLSMNWRTELSRLSVAGHLSQQQIDELWPPTAGGPGKPEAALTRDTRLAAVASGLSELLPSFPAPYTLPRSASNEWAVDGRHTATGAPLLAGDPHLAFSFPGIWYLARIETPQAVLVGATAPGVPFLVLGHNGHIAWTFTTTGADVQDVFIETPVGDNQYQTPDGPRPFIVREERIKVRGAPDEVLNVRETRHGPVVSDLSGGGQILAVAMANLVPGDSAAAGLQALNEAQDVAEAGKAAAMITSPVQNLLVADKSRIALYVTGRIPIRRAGDGAAPVPGDGSHDWIGWASGDQLPHFVAPESGRLVNGNDRIAPADFPVFLGRDWFGDFRARRIRELLSQSDRHTAADFARMQVDVTSTFARDVLPTLRAVPSAEGIAGRAQALLQDWDGSMVMDAPQPLIFNAWMHHFYGLVLRQAGVPISAGGPLIEFVAYVLSPAGAHWCGGDCKPLLQTALGTATQDLASRFGDDPGAWRWGPVHEAVFAHPVLRALPLLGRLTTLTIPSPGDDSTIDRGAPAYYQFQSVQGAAYRGVYDLADLDRSLFIVAPGQSGNPLSRHARDFLTRWRDGQTITLGPNPDATTATIRLTP